MDSSDDEAVPMEEEDLEVTEVPRVEFVPRERTPEIGRRGGRAPARPRDTRGRGRGNAQAAAEEDLRVKHVRGRLNVAMVHATFDDLEEGASDSAALLVKRGDNGVGTATDEGKHGSGSEHAAGAAGKTTEGKATTTTTTTATTQRGSPGSAMAAANAALAGSGVVNNTAVAVTATTAAINVSPQAQQDALSRAEADRLQTEFSAYLEQGRTFAKESLISRLEAELLDVENELAHMDRFRPPPGRPATARCGPTWRQLNMARAFVEEAEVATRLGGGIDALRCGGAPSLASNRRLAASLEESSRAATIASSTARAAWPCAGPMADAKRSAPPMPATASGWFERALLVFLPCVTCSTVALPTRSPNARHARPTDAAATTKA